MSEFKTYRIFGKDWSAETCDGYELDCGYKTEFILKSDHDLAIRKLKMEVSELREIMNEWIAAACDTTDQINENRLIEERRITKATGEVL